MRTVGRSAWALTLGLALALIAGGTAIVATTAAPAPAVTQELGTDMSTEPWPSADALSSELVREFPQDDPGNVTIALAARWGYLDDPAVWAMAGRWRFNDTGTGGVFAGGGQLRSRPVGGKPPRRLPLPPAGRRA